MSFLLDPIRIPDVVVALLHGRLAGSVCQGVFGVQLLISGPYIEI